MRKTVKYLFIFVSSLVVMLIFIGLYWNLQPYYKKNKYIAHALGAIDELDYTNSKEALEYSYSMGYRLMEIDLLYTSDEHLVCRHKWSDKLEDGFSENYIPDYQAFMSSKIYGKYTTLDIEAIIRFAMEHPDVYFITDTKSSELEVSEILEVIQDTSKKLEYEEFNRQFIVQFYNYEEYENINANYSFQNYIFTLYRMKGELKENGVDNILDYCISNNIKVITLPKEYATKEICEQLKQNGITIYAHTVNSRKVWFDLQLRGVNGIYSDNINPVRMSRMYMTLSLFVLNIFVFLYCLVRIMNILKYKSKVYYLAL